MPLTAPDPQLRPPQWECPGLSRWKGKVVLFSFGFTHCPNVCPTTLTNLVDVFRALPPSDRSRVHIAFISVDPRRDVPAQLKNYLSYFDPAFVGLSGPKEEIENVHHE